MIFFLPWAASGNFFPNFPTPPPFPQKSNGSPLSIVFVCSLALRPRHGLGLICIPKSHNSAEFCRKALKLGNCGKPWSRCWSKFSCTVRITCNNANQEEFRAWVRIVLWENTSHEIAQRFVLFIQTKSKFE